MPKKPPKNLIGLNIRRIRKGRNLPQRYLANICGVSTKKFSDIELGNVQPSFPFLYDLANFFNISYTNFLWSKKA